MAQESLAAANDKRRVKVYELRENNWCDRGTGFCSGQVVNDESKLVVESEDSPDSIILESRISTSDSYQRQQATLIVWTETSGSDMALSFQEPDGCAAIWEFVSGVQQQLLALAGPDDGLSDDAMEGFGSHVMLPPAQLQNLPDIEQIMRVASNSPQGRDALGRFIIQDDYIGKLVPLVQLAEDLEDLGDLHHLSTIMKTLILLNDTQIIEIMMSDGMVDGVVGALEYDQDFPNHKANHREYLQNKSRFKEVVPIKDPVITKRIHSTWRLQYLKDVVLARILDDPTFSVLNSLIFFNQVDIVTHLQGNSPFLRELFGVIEDKETTPARRKDAVCFIQQCCAIAKNLQAPARQSLYANFIQNGLIAVIVFALGQKEAPVRIAGTDILVAMIDHDPAMVRSHVFKAMTEKRTPLTDTLIDLLLVEQDLGVKSQAADAIKILLDPQPAVPPPAEGLARLEQQFLPKYRQNPAAAAQTESFIQDFYDNGAKRLFGPLKSLEQRASVQDLTFHEQSLYLHLIEILMYFVRQHLYRSKYFIAAESLFPRIAQLLRCPQKHLKLTALKFFRACIGLQDEFYYHQLMVNRIFDPILDIIFETLPRDNLLNSACLEFFEFIRQQQIKPIINYLVDQYESRLEKLTYVDVFSHFLTRYDQMQGYISDMDMGFFGQNDEIPMSSNLRLSMMNGANQRWQGVPEMDAQEEDYFNASDDDEDELAGPDPMKSLPPSMSNGISALPKPLVDYPEDDDDPMGPSNAHLQAFYETPPPLLPTLDMNNGLVLDAQQQAEGYFDGSAAPQPLMTEAASASAPTPATSTGTDGTTVTLSSAPPSPPPSPPETAAPAAALAAAAPPPPPERIAEKRRREEDEEDELGKLTTPKRRSSGSSSVSSMSSVGSSVGGGSSSASAAANSSSNSTLDAKGGGGNSGGKLLRRKANFATSTGSSSGENKKIAIARLSLKSPTPPSTATAPAPLPSAMDTSTEQQQQDKGQGQGQEGGTANAGESKGDAGG